MTVVIGVLAAQMLVQSAAQAPRLSTIFTIETDEFWLNLHHFLYVLGRAHAKMTDASQPAQRLKQILQEIWKPYLDSRGTRDEALAAVVARATESRR